MDPAVFDALLQRAFAHAASSREHIVECSALHLRTTAQLARPACAIERSLRLLRNPVLPANGCTRTTPLSTGDAVDS